MSTEVEVEVEEKENPMYEAYLRVCDFQEHTGEFADEGGAVDEDQTITAWQTMARLAVLGQLIDGTPLEWLVESALSDVKELLEGEQDE